MDIGWELQIGIERVIGTGVMDPKVYFIYIAPYINMKLQTIFSY